MVEYSSNNSGGSWWLTDAHWKALAKAGWRVAWFKNKSEQKIMRAGKDGRWLGALASHASKNFPSLKDAIVEWERITGMDASNDGCNCCGAPHSFSTKEPSEYVSGSDVVRILYGKHAPASIREAARRLSGEEV